MKWQSTKLVTMTCGFRIVCYDAFHQLKIDFPGTNRMMQTTRTKYIFCLSLIILQSIFSKTFFCELYFLSHSYLLSFVLFRKTFILLMNFTCRKNAIHPILIEIVFHCVERRRPTTAKVKTIRINQRVSSSSAIHHGTTDEGCVSFENTFGEKGPPPSPCEMGQPQMYGKFREKRGGRNIPLQILTNSIHGCKNAHPLKVTNNKSKQQNKHAKKKKKKNPFFKKINSQHYTHDTTSWCSDDHFVFAVRF